MSEFDRIIERRIRGMDDGLRGGVTIVAEHEELIVVRTRACPVCGKRQTMTLDRERFWRWQHDTYIQEAFPELSADERELLISGTDNECFQRLFAEDDDDGA
jgi:hypothetical protein